MKRRFDSSLSSINAANDLASTIYLNVTYKIPINVVENTAVDWHPSGADSLNDVGSIFAPSTQSASLVDFSSKTARALAGQAAVFKLTPHGSSSCPNGSCVLAALASVTVAAASLHIASVSAAAIDLPVDIAASVEHDCVFIIVAVPSGTPDDVVLIKDVDVAGFTVILNDVFTRYDRF